jgi:hypothetical protein
LKDSWSSWGQVRDMMIISKIEANFVVNVWFFCNIWVLVFLDKNINFVVRRAMKYGVFSFQQIIFQMASNACLFSTSHHIIIVTNTNLPSYYIEIKAWTLSSMNPLNKIWSMPCGSLNKNYHLQLIGMGKLWIIPLWVSWRPWTSLLFVCIGIWHNKNGANWHAI